MKLSTAQYVERSALMCEMWITIALFICSAYMFSVLTLHQVGIVEDLGGQLAGISFLHAPCGSWGWSSGHQAWQLMLLPVEPSCWSLMFYRSKMQLLWDSIMHKKRIYEFTSLIIIITLKNCVSPPTLSFWSSSDLYCLDCSHYPTE